MGLSATVNICLPHQPLSAHCLDQLSGFSGLGFVKVTVFTTLRGWGGGFLDQALKDSSYHPLRVSAVRYRVPWSGIHNASYKPVLVLAHTLKCTSEVVRIMDASNDGHLPIVGGLHLRAAPATCKTTNTTHITQICPNRCSTDEVTDRPQEQSAPHGMHSSICCSCPAGLCVD